MFSSSVTRLVYPAAVLKRAFLIALLFSSFCLVGNLAHAGTIATDPNQLLGGLTKYDLNDYENLYDSAGNRVTSGVFAVGDTLQGVFVINSVSNQPGTANYFPGGGGVELTGVFDELIRAVDPSGANLTLVPDTTTVTSGGPAGKTVSGAQFQATFGTGAMIAVFQNSTNAMPLGANGNGLQGLTSAQAFALATTGSEWASFGATGTWGAANGYYWASNISGPNVGAFAASLGFIQNDTNLPTNFFAPLNQAPPTGFPANSPPLLSLGNDFVIQGTFNPTSQQLAETPYTAYSTDPVQVDFVPVPEPSSFALIGSLVGVLALLCRSRGKLGR